MKLIGLVLTVLLLLTGCKRQKDEAAPAPSAAVQAPASATTASGTVPAPKWKKKVWRVPSGTSLPILPKEGVGPIRFGASLETIERLMASPCDVKKPISETELFCGYVGRAVDFYLTSNALTRIHVHRNERPHPHASDATYGPYNGWFPEGPRLEMLKDAAMEEFGNPERVEPTSHAEWNTVERHYYDGFVVEYDKLSPDRTVIGGVILDAPGN